MFLYQRIKYTGAYALKTIKILKNSINLSDLLNPAEDTGINYIFLECVAVHLGAVKDK